MGAQSPKISLTSCVSYEGQSLQNKPHGEGKITYLSSSNQIITFKGKFFHGQPTFGQLNNKNLEYVGQITQRRIEGDGILTDKQSNTIYEGKFQKGKLIEGTVQNKDSYFCKGKFYVQSDHDNSQQFKGLLHGDSSIYQSLKTNEKWKGNFWKGNITGNGEYNKNESFVYRGEFYGGKFRGNGVIQQNNEDVKKIVGNFNDSQVKSVETLQFFDGDKFSGILKNNLCDGAESEYRFADGALYRGNINQHILTGECEITYALTSPLEIYRGQVHDGKFNGLGILQYRNGIIIKGYFCQNAKNGPCILVYGERMFKGLFMMDKLIGTLQQIPKDP